MGGMRRVLRACWRGIRRAVEVIAAVAYSLQGGRSGDPSARTLYEDPKDFRP